MVFASVSLGLYLSLFVCWQVVVVVCVCVWVTLICLLLCSRVWLDHGENFYKGNLADFKLLQSPLSASDTFHMLISYPLEFNERSLPVSQLLLVDLPLRVNCTSGLPIDTAWLAAEFTQGTKYRASTAGSSHLGNSYTSSVRNVFGIPDPESHFYSPDRVKTLRQLRDEPRSARLVFPVERDLRQQQKRAALVHLAGTPGVEPLNLGDGQLSVMLTVAETKLAYIQFLREKGSELNRVGALMGDGVCVGGTEMSLLCRSLPSGFVDVIQLLLSWILMASGVY